MKRWRVLNMNEIAHIPTCLEALEEVAEVITLPADSEVLARELPDCDAYFAALKVRLTREMIASAPRLKVICTSTTGLDHLDMDAVEEHGIHLISLKYDIDFLSSVTCTAEMGWALLLAVVRKLPWSFGAACRGEWARDQYRGHQLSEMTLGILGYGRLGRIMARIGNGFNMRVLATDVKPVDPEPYVTMVDLETLLRESDAVSIHIHLTEETTGFIGREQLAMMKQGAYLVNTSRGAIIDEAALIDALGRGHLGGAGVDVIHGEWDPDLANHPMIRYAATHDNLVISPHTGGITYESQGMAMAHSARKLAAYLQSLE